MAETPAGTAGGNGNGGRLEAHLQEVEVRLTRIETKLDAGLKHVATKAWVLGGLLAGMGVAVVVAFTIAVVVLYWM